MKITQVSVWREEFSLTRPYAIAFRDIQKVSMLFLKLENEMGHLGLGCASPEKYVTQESIDDSEKALQSTALEWLKGRKIEELPLLCQQVKAQLHQWPAARACLDIALYDLWSQERQLPLVQALGQCYQSLPTSITLGIRPLDETLKEAEEYLKRGFKILKLKLGSSLEEDIERTLKLREVVGRAFVIRVDLNQAHTVEDFLSYYKSTQEANIQFYEQPLKASAIEEMKQLPKEIRKDVMVDESLITEQDAELIVKAPIAAGSFNIKLMKCGGITSGRNMANMAHRENIDVMWGCMDESRISIAAALHLAMASPATKYLDLDGHLDLDHDLVEGGFILNEGSLSLTPKPGLGVSLL